MKPDILDIHVCCLVEYHPCNLHIFPPHRQHGKQSVLRSHECPPKLQQRADPELLPCLNQELPYNIVLEMIEVQL